MGNVLVQEINDNCEKITHMRTMDRGFTTNANDKTEWKRFRIFEALVLKLISENSLQDI
jgi:hypothetical protein